MSRLDGPAGQSTGSLTLWQRLATAIVIGVASGVLCHVLLLSWGFDVQANDFTYPWIGARALLHGQDPYVAATVARTPWGEGLLYPLPALLIATPLAWLPAHDAGVAFTSISFGILAFLLSSSGMWRLLIFASAPALQACISVQWSPLFTAAALLPPALGILAAKPNFGLPLLGYQSTRRAWLYALAGGALLLSVSFLLMPNWVSQWLDTLRSNHATRQYAIPLATWIGWPAALALLRWRRPEARLLVCMACVPQLGFFYDQLLLFLIPDNRRELMTTVVLADLAYALALAVDGGRLGVGVSNLVAFPYMVAGVYLPALFLVLRRPNVGPVPNRIDRFARRLPLWIAGNAVERA